MHDFYVTALQRVLRITGTAVIHIPAPVLVLVYTLIKLAITITIVKCIEQSERYDEGSA